MSFLVLVARHGKSRERCTSTISRYYHFWRQHQIQSDGSTYALCDCMCCESHGAYPVVITELLSQKNTRKI
ncbi:hypothetical protein ACHAXM_005767 [Skeletonema potamos]